MFLVKALLFLIKNKNALKAIPKPSTWILYFQSQKFITK